MKTFIFVFILSLNCWATMMQALPTEQRSYTREEAFDITSGAILQHPDIQPILRATENWGWRTVEYIGLDSETVRTLATVGAPIIHRKISTKGLKYKWEPIKNFSIRPDIEYYVPTKDFKSYLNLAWGF